MLWNLMEDPAVNISFGAHRGKRLVNRGLPGPARWRLMWIEGDEKGV
jgi:hypothetical protein